MFVHRLALVSILFFAAPAPAQAAPKHFRVGPGCPYATINAALNAERASPGAPADFIWIARNPNNDYYTAQDIQIHDQSVFLYGGVDSCTDTSISGTTKLSGYGGAAKSVMTISGDSHVWLSGLMITQGDNNSSGIGGGINFGGTGTLKISSTTITNNRAGYGGGIQFNGTDAFNPAELWINYETLITNNTATTSGGGIRVEGYARLRVTDPQVLIALNHADGGYGGGVQVIGPAKAFLGSPGYRFVDYLGLVYENTAKYGAGVAINGGSGDYQDAAVCLFTTDAQHPVRIEGNIASQDGGGIYLRPNAGGIGSYAGLQGSDYRITGNSAQEGSAIYSGHDSATFAFDEGSDVTLRGTCTHAAPSTLGAVNCTSEECNRIDGNVAQNISGQPTAGSTLLIQPPSAFAADRLRLIGNRGAHVIRAVGGYTSGVIGPIAYVSQFGSANCLIAENVTTSDLLLAGSQTYLGLKNCTLGSNSIGAGSAAIKAGGEIELTNDIFAQGGSAPSLDYTGGNTNNLQINYVMAQEVASLASGAHVVQADPLFVNAARGDYHLQPNSPAIDVAPASGPFPLDLDGYRRAVDYPGVRNLDGIVDLGAYERQGLGVLQKF